MKAFFNDLVLYGLVIALSRLIAFLTFPIYAKTLLVEDFGVFDTIVLAIQGLAILFGIGLDSYLYRNFNECSSHSQRAKLISTCLFLQLISSILLSLLLAISFGSFVNGNVHNGENWYVYLFNISLLIPFVVLLTSAEAVMRISFARWRYSIIALAYPLTQFLLASAISYYKRGSIEDFLMGYSICIVIFSGISLFLIRDFISKIELRLVSTEMLGYALPIGLVAFLVFSFALLERYMLLSYFGEVELGLYSVASKIALLMAMPASVIQATFLPYIFKYYKTPQMLQSINQVFILILFSLSVLYIFISYFTPEIINNLATPAYQKADYLVPALIFANVMNCIAVVAGAGTILSRSTKWRLGTTFLSYGSFILMTIYTIADFGVFGVAYSLAISRLFYLLIEMIIANRLHRLSWSYPSIVSFVLLMVFLWVGSQKANILDIGHLELAVFQISLAVVWLSASWRRRFSAMV